MVTDVIAKLGPAFRMLALSVVVVFGGSLLAYLAAIAILWLVSVVFGS